MNAANQEEIIAFLSRPEIYGGTVSKVVRTETRFSYVFLAGPRAFKLKKAISSSVADLSTMEARHTACSMEIALGRPMAPTLYRGLMRVTRESDGSLMLGGIGQVVDWLVSMNRFEQSALFERHYKRDSSEYAGMMQLADLVARFHATAARDFTHGGIGGIRQEIERLRTGETPISDTIFSPEEWASLADRMSDIAETHAPLLEERREKGFVRHCHNDLHFGNICFYENRPTPFGAMGLSDELTRTDVLYDIALLLADMNARGLSHLSNYFFNHYMDVCGDHDGLSVMPLFLSLRAAHYAKTLACNPITSGSERKSSAVQQRIRRLFADAGRYLSPSPPCLVAIGGFSGSGKSHLTREIAPVLGDAPGAVMLRTDVVRKKILGIDLDEELDADGYTAAMSERAYGGLYKIATRILQAGRSVVVDAVCASPEQRRALEDVARFVNVPFQGFWLQPPSEVLSKRVKKYSPDAADILRLQFSKDIGTMTWHVIDSSVFKEKTVQKAEGVLEKSSIPIRLSAGLSEERRDEDKISRTFK